MRFEIVTKEHYSNKIGKGINSKNCSDGTKKFSDDFLNYPFHVKSDLEIYALWSILSDLVSDR